MSYASPEGCNWATLLLRTSWHGVRSRLNSALFLESVLKNAYVWVFIGAIEGTLSVRHACLYFLVGIYCHPTRNILTWLLQWRHQSLLWHSAMLEAPLGPIRQFCTSQAQMDILDTSTRQRHGFLIPTVRNPTRETNTLLSKSVFQQAQSCMPILLMRTTWAITTPLFRLRGFLEGVVLWPTTTVERRLLVLHFPQKVLANSASLCGYLRMTRFLVKSNLESHSDSSKCKVRCATSCTMVWSFTCATTRLEHFWAPKDLRLYCLNGNRCVMHMYYWNMQVADTGLYRRGKHASMKMGMKFLVHCQRQCSTVMNNTLLYIYIYVYLTLVFTHMSAWCDHWFLCLRLNYFIFWDTLFRFIFIFITKLTWYFRVT